jgi:hypothetical protein
MFKADEALNEYNHLSEKYKNHDSFVSLSLCNG